ncbi:hypothetical protein MIMGU_mgv1a024521mg [Erythranthe guttata]|uniref:Uncharacterized protein n=1 Tax=Erythranthe guttata TaxID=4155 RepID=A0A022PXT4_ERYGU|nr:hypothetical protein MIMGU_mgv1a024521mg [Erythranthe guttata]
MRMQVRQEEKKMKVKKGWVAVQVGLGGTIKDENQDCNCTEFMRFVIPISYLYNPLFQRLLDKAHEIYVYRAPGPLTLPCSIDDFLHILTKIETSDFRLCPSRNVVRSVNYLLHVGGGLWDGNNQSCSGLVPYLGRVKRCFLWVGLSRISARIRPILWCPYYAVDLL